jgi:hypothetical protein
MRPPGLFACTVILATAAHGQCEARSIYNDHTLTPEESRAIPPGPEPTTEPRALATVPMAEPSTDAIQEQVSKSQALHGQSARFQKVCGAAAVSGSTR